MTIANIAGQVGQAVALHVEGDRCVFRRCRLLATRIRIWLPASKAVSIIKSVLSRVLPILIFGAATAVFDRCTFSASRIPISRLPRRIPAGSLVLCFSIASFWQTNPDEECISARPWRSYASVAFIRCDMGSHILPEGWHNWNKPEAEKTARYAEYKSSGPGANPALRVPWSRQMTDEKQQC